MPPEYKTFDAQWALSRLGDDTILLAEVAQLFIEESRTLMAALRSAAARQDAHGVEIAAHTLKGSASNFGATEFCQDALALERSGRRGDSAGIEERLAAFERSAARFLRELEQLVADTIPQ